MLLNPYFRTCQRFRRVAGDGRDYLALWTIETPEALQTPEYLSQWGFSEWSPLITDWSRDLFDGRGAPERTFAVRRDGALEVVSFDGMDGSGAQDICRKITKVRPDLMWLPIAGLDRHTPLIGLGVLAEAGAWDQPSGFPDGAQHALYRPISDCHTANA
jgi:hypothetical protein